MELRQPAVIWVIKFGLGDLVCDLVCDLGKIGLPDTRERKDGQGVMLRYYCWLVECCRNQSELVLQNAWLLLKLSSVIGPG